MNQTRLLIIGGALLLLIIGALGLYTIQRAQQPSYGTTYTDSISGQQLLATPTADATHVDADADLPLTNQITITGLDDFLASMTADQSSHVLADITQFVRARVGAQTARAGVLNGDIKKVSSNPVTYQFVLVLVNPASRFTVSVVVPNADSPTLPSVTFSGVSQ